MMSFSMRTPATGTSIHLCIDVGRREDVIPPQRTIAGADGTVSMRYPVMTDTVFAQKGEAA